MQRTEDGGHVILGPTSLFLETLKRPHFQFSWRISVNSLSSSALMNPAVLPGPLRRTAAERCSQVTGDTCMNEAAAGGTQSDPDSLSALQHVAWLMWANLQRNYWVTRAAKCVTTRFSLQLCRKWGNTWLHPNTEGLKHVWGHRNYEEEAFLAKCFHQDHIGPFIYTIRALKYAPLTA